MTADAGRSAFSTSFRRELCFASPGVEASRQHVRYGGGMLRSSSRRPLLAPILFVIYFALYGGFVVLAAFSPATMDRPIGGINLAVWYGFVLIIAAVVLALIYGAFAPADATPAEEA